MTGYGSSNLDNESLNISVETKTLNSKFLDISIKIPKQLSSYEPDIKNLITKHIVRGKVAFTIEIVSKPGQGQQSLVNKELVERYFTELKELNHGRNISDETLFSSIMNLPDVVAQENDNECEIDAESILKLCRQSLDKCTEFRIQEGKALTKEFQNSIESISQKLDEIISIDPQRITSIKERVHGNIREFVGQDKIDENRFEQELIYYVEKLDINEETSRLTNHLKYFLEVLDQPESQGKKLGFISQEIGREINTIGSKANNADMQRLVVDMKDELEKIKEQVLNAV